MVAPFSAMAAPLAEAPSIILAEGTSGGSPEKKTGFIVAKHVGDAP